MDGEKRQQNIVDQLAITHTKMSAAWPSELCIGENANCNTKIPWNTSSLSEGRSSTEDIVSFAGVSTEGSNDGIHVR